MSTLSVVLQNNADASSVYVVISGTDSARNTLWLLQSDGTTEYYPANPTEDGQALQVDCNIMLGGSGSRRVVEVPPLSGARVWFAQEAPLTFLLNRGESGPALVTPSPTNTADANYGTRWDFCELTYTTGQVFANISYVDFVSVPVALRLDVNDGSGTQTVMGLPSDGLDIVCSALQTQHASDGADWDQLVVVPATSATSATSTTSYLRALSPSAGMAAAPGLFEGYYDAYVDAVWTQYAATTLQVDTQASWGTVSGQVSQGLLQFPGTGTFSKPATADIFSCSTGPFAVTGNAEMGNIAARLAAACNRSTLLVDSRQPDGESVASYYANTVTNHYARIVHATSLDGRGYAFPYDDVTPTNGADQSGAVSSSSPACLTIYIGGLEASSTSRRNLQSLTRVAKASLARPGRQLVGGRRQKRTVPALFSSLVDEKKGHVTAADELPRLPLRLAVARTAWSLVQARAPVAAQVIEALQTLIVAYGIRVPAVSVAMVLALLFLAAVVWQFF